MFLLVVRIVSLEGEGTPMEPRMTPIITAKAIPAMKGSHHEISRIWLMTFLICFMMCFPSVDVVVVDKPPGFVNPQQRGPKESNLEP